ncbi:MAG: host-nuclease inhibitor Gam family protein [Leptospiraceae bacterium]|nr:host-nuclease inhibitor Gam family protein [Leptospiraceae bacterium]
MATRRVKPKAHQIKTIDDANSALADIARLQIQLEQIDNEASIEIGKIKERAAKDGKPIRDQIEALGNSLATFGEYNKDELFGDKRTVTVSYGIFGFRKSTKIRVKKTTLELLQKLFQGDGIRIKEEVDREALKDWDESDLAQVDAAKVTEDNFFYEVDREAINQNLLNAKTA